MDRESILEHQRREKEFRATPVGNALNHFENTTIEYWQLDGMEHGSYARLSAAAQRQKEARDRLVALLRPLLGLDNG